MIDETHLLRQYAEQADEGAFAELVRHKVDFVYSAALRQVNGDTQLADEVTQSVFLDLARKARSLTRHAALAGWLYTSTRFAAAKAVRTQQRWHQRNREAQAMHEIEHPSPGEPGWAQLRPVLDAALGELGDRDREALLLRFFEDRPLAEVGARIGLSENSARMRVDRALDKLRTALARRGVTSTTAALALILSQEAVTAAPMGLAAAAAGSALAGVAAAGGVGAAKILSLMAISKIQAGAAGLLGLALIAGLLLQQHDNRQLRAENDRLRQQSAGLAALQRENQRLTEENAAPRRAVRLMPPDNPNGSGMPAGSLATSVPSGKFTLAFNAEDPELSRLMDIQLKGQLEARYGALFKMLNLAPAQREQLKKLLLDRQNAPRDVVAAAKVQGLSDTEMQGNLPAMIDRTHTEIDSRITELLGNEGYAQYQQYQNTLPQRSLADQLASRLSSSSTPLTGEQAEQLVQILAANPAPTVPDAMAVGPNQVVARSINGATWTSGSQPMVMFGNPGSGGTVGPNLNNPTISDAALNQAQGILAPAQIEALRQLQAEQQASQALAQHMMQTITGRSN